MSVRSRAPGVPCGGSTAHNRGRTLPVAQLHAARAGAAVSAEPHRRPQSDAVRVGDVLCFAVALCRTAAARTCRRHGAARAPRPVVRGGQPPTRSRRSARIRSCVIRCISPTPDRDSGARCCRAPGTCRSSWSLLSFIYHERIAAREEAFLHATFGDSFRQWAGDVPAMIPAVGRYRPSGVPFQLRKVLIQESHGLCAIGTAFLVLDTLEDSVRTGGVPRRSAMAGRVRGDDWCRC